MELPKDAALQAAEDVTDAPLDATPENALNIPADGETGSEPLPVPAEATTRSRFPSLRAGLIVLAFFLLSGFVRSQLAANVRSFRFINDEMLYWNMAHSLWQQGRLLYHGVPITFVNLLYPLFLAPLTAIGDVAEAFAASKILGSLLISSAVFPAYLIGRRLLKGRFWPLCLALISLLVPEMIFSALMLTEVVFYPLALWFCYLVVRYLDVDTANHRRRLALIAFMALFALLLFLSKTSSIFLPFSFGLFLIVEAWLDDDLKWRGLQRIGLYGGLFLFVYLFFNIAFIFGNQLSANTATELNTLVQYFSLIEQVPYVLLCTLLYLIVFTISAFFFPVVLPLLHYRDYAPQRRKLALYTLIALIVGSLIIVLTISLKEDYPDYQPRIHLRYLFPIIFLWLPLGIEAITSFHRRDKGWLLGGLSALVLFPYLYLNTSAHSLILYDAPSRALLQLAKNSDLDFINGYALIRFLAVLAILLFAWLLSRDRHRSLLCVLLLAAYGGFGIASGAVLQKHVAPELTSYQQSLVAEATAIGNYLQEHDGNILLFTKEPRGDAMLEPYLGRPYYLLWQGEKEFHDYLWQEGSRADLGERKLPIHVQYSTYNMRPHLESIRYLLVSGGPFQTHFLEESMRLIELDTEVFKLYELAEPQYLYPQATLSGPLAKEPMVEEHRLRWLPAELPESRQLLLELDIELEEDPPEDGLTLRISDGETAETLTLTKKRSRQSRMLTLPEDAEFFDLWVEVLDGDEQRCKHRIHSYKMRILQPKH